MVYFKETNVYYYRGIIWSGLNNILMPNAVLILK